MTNTNILGWSILPKKDGKLYATKRVKGKVVTIYIGKYLEHARPKIIEWYKQNKLNYGLEDTTDESVTTNHYITEGPLEMKLNSLQKFNDLLFEDIKNLYRELEKVKRMGLNKVLWCLNEMEELKKDGPFLLGHEFLVTGLHIYLVGKDHPVPISRFKIGQYGFLVDGKETIFYDQIQKMEYVGYIIENKVLSQSPKG